MGARTDARLLTLGVGDVSSVASLGADTAPASAEVEVVGKPAVPPPAEVDGNVAADVPVAVTIRANWKRVCSTGSETWE
jgi:hypothetical protein